MRFVLGLTAVVLAGCGSGTIDLGDDAPARRCPAARVDVESLDWALVKLDANGDQVLVVTNHCRANNGDLVVDLAVDGSDRFSASESTLTLGPGESAEVVVQYVAPDYEAATATLRISTNDEDRPTFDVPLTGSTNPDQDADGFNAVEAGGDDCDDADPNVRPGVDEDWYDGVDQNCDGLDDFDQDGDGFRRAPEGGDCNDLIDTIYPEAAELPDYLDNDCDGLVDEDFVKPGDLVVSELMVDPVAVFDTSGEWFEVTNISERTIDMRNWTVVDYAGDSFQVVGTLAVPPGTRLVFGVEADPAKNGGVELDYVYDRSSFELDNAKDAVGLDMGGSTVTLLEYDVAWSVTPGASLSLDPAFVDPRRGTQGKYWCSAVSGLPDGDLGTPGGVNDVCTSVDHDGDGYSVDQGDCDDADGHVYPGADDVWNGIDTDCDGTVDNGAIDDISAGWVDGDGVEYLGTWAGLSVGDLDDDGVLEVLVGTSRSGGTWNGEIHMLSGSKLDTMNSVASDYEEAHFSSRKSVNNMGFMGRRMGDVTGDGVHDLLVAGNGAGGNPALMLWKGGSGVSGNLNDGDVVATWGPGGRYDNSRSASFLDLDGDGTSEVLMGDPGASNGTDWRDRFLGALHVIDAVGASGHASLEDSEYSWFGDNQSDLVGTVVDGADLDADGYDDVVVCGSFTDGSGTFNSGGCYFVFGGKTLPEGSKISDVADGVIYGSTSNERLGHSPALDFGDVDDDGKVDMVIGAGLQSQVLIFNDVGSMTGTHTTADADQSLRVRSGPTNLGWSVAVADLDDDGYDDVIAGAPDSMWLGSFSADEPGRILVWGGVDLASGAKRMYGDDASHQAKGGASKDLFGWALIAEDFDGDGKVDVAASAPTNASNAGRVYFLLGE